MMRPEELGIGTLFERIRDAVIVANPETQQIVLWNPAAANLFGYRLSEVPGLRVEALVPEDLKPQHRTGIARYAETGHGSYIDSHRLLELPALKKEGEEILVEMSLSPIGAVDATEDGQGRLVLAIIRDITQRKRADEALREAERRFRSAFGNAPIGMAVVGLDGRFLQVNRSLCEILGYSEEELLNISYKGITYPEDFDASMRCERQVLGGETSKYHLEKRYLHADGHLVWVSLNVSLVRDSKNRPLYFISQFQDISEHKRAEEERSRLADIVESSSDAIISKTLDGTIATWNRGAQKIYGYSADEAVGKPIDILIPPERSSETAQMLEKIGRGEAVLHHETTRITKDGRRIDVSITASPLKDPSGKIVGVSTIARDITERKRAEKEIQRLNEELEERVAERTEQLSQREDQLKSLVGKLVASQEEERRRVAYEVHDGLTQVAISAHQQLQAFADAHPPGSTVGPGELDRALELVHLTVREARRVIEGLRPTALDDFGLATALKLHVEELRKEGWRIDYKETLGEDRLPDEIETALYRIAQEALVNIRKHAQTTEARLTLAQVPGKIRLEVRDEGCGFDLPTVSEGNGKGPGERVGLSGMRERVALLGGEFEVTSKPGAGTTLVAEVPLLEASEKTGD